MPASDVLQPEAGTLVLELSKELDGISEGAAELIAVGEHKMRRDLADGVQRVFVICNSALWIVIALLIMIDTALIVGGWQLPRDRIIDKSVVKVLVGATVVQVGLIMVAIAGNLFPKIRADGRPFWKQLFG